MGTAVSSRDQAWDDLMDCLQSAGVLDGRGPLADRMVERVFTLPSYRHLGRDELHESWCRNLSVSLDGVRERRLPGPDDDDTPLREVGEMRARQGVSVAEMLQTSITHQKVFLDLVRDLAPASPHRDSLLLELFSTKQTWAAWGMVAMAAGHREAELEMQRREREDHDGFVRRVLSGGAAASEIGQGAEAYGLDRSRSYHAFRVRPDHHRREGADTPRADTSRADTPRADTVRADTVRADTVRADTVRADMLRAMERYLQISSADGRRNGMMTMIDGDLCGFLAVLPDDLPPTPVGVSPPVPLTELPAVFRLATRALETALATGRREIVGIADLGLLPAVVADHDLGELMYRRFVAPFESMGPSGAAVLETVRRYVANGSRLEATRQELFLHTNTVRYRLSRFEAVTRCSLRDNDALVQVWWALAWQATGARNERAEGDHR
ncbi:MAG: helix-turn-helix domain-containing protein [Pseudonocardia sp.]|nr:helix-turn-helix domain-containing protein [Pseudonocardia sp.]